MTANELGQSAGQGDGSSAEPWYKNAVGLLESVVKISGILAAFGYMALRAHINFLGFSDLTGLGPERYLMETYGALSSILLPLSLRLVKPLCAGSLLVLGLSWIATRKRVRDRWARLTRLRNWNVRTTWDDKRLAMLYSPYTPLIWIAVTTVFLLLVMAGLQGETGIAVGCLDAKALSLSKETLENAHRGIRLIDWVVCVCLAGFLLNRASSTVIRERPEPAFQLSRTIWKVALLLTALLALMTPILYGRTVRSTKYPVVNVSMKTGDSKPHCGLLIQESGNEIRLWQATKGRGYVNALPRAEIKSYELGDEADVLELAIKATQGGSHPGCP